MDADARRVIWRADKLDARQFKVRTAELVRQWLDYRGQDIEWLFCPIYQGKVIDRCLETTTVKRVIREAAKRCGLPADQVASFSGHSMRVGAAQDLLKRGFDTAAIGSL